MRKKALSTTDVARLFSVTETTVKRWADDGTLKCQKTPGGHRKFQIRYVIEFAEQNQFEPTGTLSPPCDEANGEALQMAILGRDFSTLIRTFVEKALSPDRTDLYLFFSYLYEHRFALWEIYDMVLKPGMTEIGERWAKGEIGVNHEHRASYETLDALAKLQNEILIKPPAGDSVVLACLRDELHEIGLRCAANTFESEGWQTHYLGAQTPSDAVLDAARDLRPTVVALSVTGQHEPGLLTHELLDIANAVRGLGGRLIIGGMGVPADFRTMHWHDGIVNSARELVTYVEHHASERRMRQTSET
jgi:excisionase family DNA binding protein